MQLYNMVMCRVLVVAWLCTEMQSHKGAKAQGTEVQGAEVQGTEVQGARLKVQDARCKGQCDALTMIQ